VSAARRARTAAGRYARTAMAGLAVAGLLLSGTARGEFCPARPIHLIVPFTPGGSTDILARTVGRAVSDAAGQQVVIDNRPGAGGILGAEAAARAPADGCTLLMGHVGTLAVNPGLYPGLSYDPARDFAPVTLFALVPNVLAVHPSLAAANLAELVALARARPGTLTYSSGGSGSAAHLATEYLKKVTGTDIVHVPYKGTGPAVTDLIGGQVSMTMTGLPPLLPHIRSGRVRALAVAAATRLPLLPQVPTVAESGYPGFEATQWYGVVAPRGTPPATIDRLHGWIQASLQRSDVKARLESEGAVPSGLGPAAFAGFIQTETARWRKVIVEAGIRPD